MLKQKVKKIIEHVQEKGRIPHFDIYQLRSRLSSLSDSSFRNLLISGISGNNEKAEFNAYFSLGYGELRRKFSPYDHILLHPNLKVAYIYVPKNACTSMKLSFMESIRPNILDEIGGFPGNVHPVAEQELRITSCILPDNLTTLVITRNPIDRFWSAYIDKFIKRPEQPIINRFMNDMCKVNLISNQAVFEDVKLGNILEYICGAGDHLIDKHFASQSAFIPSLLPTFNIKIEHLNYFTSLITHLIGVSPKLDRSPHANSYTAECDDLITEDTTISELRDIITKNNSTPSSSALTESIKRKLNIRFEDDCKYYVDSF